MVYFGSLTEKVPSSVRDVLSIPRRPCGAQDTDVSGRRERHREAAQNRDAPASGEF